MAKPLKDVLARRISLAMTDKQHRHVTNKRKQKERGYATANHWIRDLIDRDMK